MGSTFNLEGLFSKLYNIVDTCKNNKVLLIINDPCQNPSGYSMEMSEWHELIRILNKICKSGIDVYLIHDIAYIDYFSETMRNQEKPSNILMKLKRIWLFQFALAALRLFVPMG